nr:glutamate receptor ionotropic, delta-1-like [Cherax quadricarinatus]
MILRDKKTVQEQDPPREETTVEIVRKKVSNMMGQEVRIVSLLLFPYTDFTRDNGNNKHAIITPRDSLDFRIIKSLAATQNFTFKVSESKAFGDEMNGSFTGLIGHLQREEADFCTIVTPTSGRLKVTDFARVYPGDLFVLVSLKPSVLPEHLAVVRPFRSELWLALLVSVVAWGVALWILQRAWSWAAGERSINFMAAFLYGWGALLNTPPSDPSINNAGRVLVGVWLLFCLVISTGFQSSLIAHLTVQDKSSTMDSFQDMVREGNWRWGSEPWFYSGSVFEYFSKHTDPVMKQIHKEMEVLTLKEALKKVLAGRYSIIAVKNYITVIVMSWYTDAGGQTPVYISNKGVNIIACFGWAYRKGSPFKERFIQLISRLEDAGIIKYWTDDVIEKRVKENRKTSALDSHPVLQTIKEENNQVVLGIDHLQGAFYLLFVGSVIALLTLLLEKLTHTFFLP